MTSQPQYLKTQQVADALGIGVSTVKRWVDSGEIPATRTIGRHRLISANDAIRFARGRKLATAKLEGLAKSDDSASGKVDPTIVDQLTSVLKEGRTREAKRLIVTAYHALGSASALADQVLGPVMFRIGYGWSIGTWDVFEEHQASLIVLGVISDLIARLNQDGDSLGLVAIGAGPEGDPCTLGLMLGELTLREIGWDVKNLGPNLPLRSLARAVRLLRPRLIFVSISHLLDPIVFLKDYTEVSEAARAEGSTIVLGGNGLPREIPALLGDARFGDRMAFLEDIGRDLLQASQAATAEPTRS